MEWHKLGKIFEQTGALKWAQHSALQPTPIVLDDKVRVFCGFRDDAGSSRVGYVDLDIQNPMKVLKVSLTPVLDLGDNGAFDQDGVVPCAVVKKDNLLLLYYAGYLRCEKVRFQVFGGLAVSSDGGETFLRHSRVPVIDRTEEAVLFRVIHSILPEGNNFKVWYGAGSEFSKGKIKTLPVYNIRYMDSHSCTDFPRSGVVALDIVGDEHRVGRPYVIKHANRYIMFFGAGSEDVPYKLCYATSDDGVFWSRMDDLLGLDLSVTGWDSEMMAYPAIFSVRDSVYLLYNGNNYGHGGFGCAKLVSW